jgi:hypothetical protein
VYNPGRLIYTVCMKYMDDIELRVLGRLLAEQNSRGNEIHVFDFDDTLVKTKSKIYLTSRDEVGNEVKTTLNPREYAQYERQRGDVFDYSDFEQVIEPEPVKPMMLNLMKSIHASGIDNVFILTARGNSTPVREFLNSQGVPEIRIFAVGTSDPKAKANVIKDEVLSRDDISEVTFYDDAAKNIMAVRALRASLPKIKNVKIKTIRVKTG